jgi:hypothetical protein
MLSHNNICENEEQLYYVHGQECFRFVIECLSTDHKNSPVDCQEASKFYALRAHYFKINFDTISPSTN